MLFPSDVSPFLLLCPFHLFCSIVDSLQNTGVLVSARYFGLLINSLRSETVKVSAGYVTACFKLDESVKGIRLLGTLKPLGPCQGKMPESPVKPVMLDCALPTLQRLSQHWSFWFKH